MVMRVLCALCVCSFAWGLQAKVAVASQRDMPFMLVSGVTAMQDMCIVGDAGAVLLVDCLAAITQGDGKELWQLQGNGNLVSAVSGLCVAATGSSVSLVSCATASPNSSQWEAVGSGQLKLAGVDLCLTQQGPAPGEFDLAPAAAASASSTASAAHGADKALDNDDITFWASEFDPKAPVVFTLDLGDSKRVQELEIVWEFPAKGFSVSVASGGGLQQVFSTSSNVLPVSRIDVGSVVRTIVVTMTEPSRVLGSFDEHSIYGIKSLAALGLQMTTTVMPCAEAARSVDARDKYFMNYVPIFDPAPMKAWASAAPSLEAAEEYLSVAVSELVDASPRLVVCKSKPLTLASGTYRDNIDLARAPRAATGDSSVKQLMDRARSAIAAARKVLA